MSMWLIVVTGGKVFILDLAAKIDQCAEYICKQQWGDLEFPPPFGREAFPEVIVCIIILLIMKSMLVQFLLENLYLQCTNS